MKVDATACQNFEQALGLERLETNGRGGFASGTVAGANTTRYHTLLLTGRKPPSERSVTQPGNGSLWPSSSTCMI